MKPLFRSSIAMLLCSCLTALSSCKKQRWADNHPVPSYAKYRLKDKYLSAVEGEMFRSIVLNAEVTTARLYRESDATIYCFKTAGSQKADLFSIYLDEHFIFVGDWLDARTDDMQDKNVECLRLSKGDTLLLRQLIAEKESGE